MIVVDVEPTGWEPSPMRGVEYEQQLLGILHDLCGYPYEQEKDLTLLHDLVERFPDLDALDQLRALAIYAIDNSFARRKNPRLDIWNWFKRGDRYLRL